MIDTVAWGDDLPWVVWNGSSGLLSTAATGRVEHGPEGRRAWLAKPFDMVGPIDLDQLEREGRLAFAACLVMSRARWQLDQEALRRESRAQRRAAQERAQRRADQARRADGARGAVEEGAHRAALNLPAEGSLRPAQIKAAYRRMAQRAHPDVGGSHDAFLRVTAARDALLELSEPALQ